MHYILPMLLIASVFASGTHSLKLSNYLDLQEALANDDLKKALAAHETICKKELSQVKTGYKDCSKKMKDISALRESFKSLSEVYIAHAAEDDLKRVMKASCPMANAKWLQKVGTIRNPYYGKSMLECGEKI